MVELTIPGRGKFTLENVVFDYNGTLAVDGRLDKEVKDNLIELNRKFNVYILTADTYRTVNQECKYLDLEVKTFSKENAGIEKKKILEGLGRENSIAVGNGFNDIDMFQESALAFLVIGKEGCCGRLFLHADLVFNNIFDVFGALTNTDRIKAGLRT